MAESDDLSPHNYAHTQIGYMLRLGMWLGASLYPLILLVRTDTETQRVTILIAVFTGLFLFIGGWIFGSLTVKVTDATVQWYFGPGFWKKSIARDQIMAANPIRTKWWYGFGIRLSPHGWLYNVQGLDAVQIDHAGRSTLIGTDDPNGLANALSPKNKI